MELAEIKKIYHRELDGLYPAEEVDSFFYRAVEHYLGLERFVLVLQPHLTITKNEEQPLFETLAQLKLEKPLQYILGVAHFMDLELKVNENVLIPRPETEELVQWILDTERSRSVVSTKRDDRKPKILDIGTGTGCIAISLAKHLSKAEVYALDVSEKALQLAKENAESNEVSVHFIQADILNSNEDFENTFDIIVSNPPYVRESEKKEIRNNVKAYEPDLALFVPDEDPLVFYRAIARFAKSHLKPGGQLYLEINQYLAKETEKLLIDYNFTDVELRKDIFGNFRMLRGNMPLREDRLHKNHTD